MKYIFIIASVFFVPGNMQAQAFSCAGAARFNATWSTSLQQLDYVSITLQQDKAAKNADINNRAEQSNNTPASFYAVQGATATASFSSLEANIGFSVCTAKAVFEVYKAAIKNGMRTFTIPAGTNGSTSVNIPIQVIYPLGWSATSRDQKGIIQIKFTNGYLSPGEYILIDKASLSVNGAQMKGVAFSIK